MTFEFIPEELVRSFADWRYALGYGSDEDLSTLSSFDSYCARERPGSCEITQEMVDEWCAPRPTEKDANSTRARIYPVVRFVRYLRARGLSDLRDPEIPRAVPSAYVPHAFTDEELSAFFAACDDWPMGMGRPSNRNLKITVPVFFRLLYSSGIRTTEARLLGRGDVDLESGVLDIRRSKGRHQHFVVLHDSMLELMRRYDSAIAGMYPDRAYFFPKNVEEGRTADWVCRVFNEAWARVGADRATAYELRHNYAIENINSWVGMGFDFHDKLVYLSKSMGHCDLENTKRYYALAPALSDVLDDRSGRGFDDIVPEVRHEETY